MTATAEWLAQRRLGIGGSDCSSLFNEGYGCKRRLWYDKRNTPEDFPRQETLAMSLGKVLEPFFAERYRSSANRLVNVHDEPFVHPEIPFLRVNVDRSVYKSLAGPMGVLEIKSVGRAVYYKTKREGLWPDAIYQLQHGMLVTDATWGSYAIGSRDSGELMYWDVERSEALCDEILAEAPKFWASVENGPVPDALDPDDKRCQRCEYRMTCQGNALIQLDGGEIKPAEELRPLLDEYMERKALLDQAEELVEETGEQLRTELGDRQQVQVGKHKVYFRPQAGRSMWDGKSMAEYYGKMREILVADGNPLLEKFPPKEGFFSTSKPSRPLRIF